MSILKTAEPVGAPFLPLDLDAVTSGIYGNGTQGHVENMYQNYRNQTFPQELGLYNSNLACAQGTANVDSGVKGGGCICPGSQNTAPLVSQPMDNSLYNDFLGQNPVQISAIDQALMKVRGPFPAAYQPLNY